MMMACLQTALLPAGTMTMTIGRALQTTRVRLSIVYTNLLHSLLHWRYAKRLARIIECWAKSSLATSLSNVSPDTVVDDAWPASSSATTRRNMLPMVWLQL